MPAVLAGPPRKVSVMMARWKSCGQRRATTAKTDPYKVATMPTPNAAHTA